MTTNCIIGERERTAYENRIARRHHEPFTLRRFVNMRGPTLDEDVARKMLDADERLERVPARGQTMWRRKPTTSLALANASATAEATA